MFYKERIKKIIILLLIVTLGIPNCNTVKAEDSLETKNTVIELDSTKIDETDSYSDIVFNKKNNGIYFLNKKEPFYTNSQNYEMIFYDIDKNSYESVYSIVNVDTSYVGTDAVYFAKNERSELSEPITEGDITYKYSFEVTIYKYDLDSCTQSSIVLDKTYSPICWGNYVDCIGVDDKGRIYINTNDSELHLFDSNGNHLSKKTYQGKIREFYGFDSTNGNFYYKGYYNWVYWGYDHDMASLMAGNVDSNNNIAMPEANLMILYQSYSFEHKKSVAMLNNKYLAAFENFTGDDVLLLDSNAYDYTDFTEQSTSINVVDNSVSISVLNVKDNSIVKMAAQTGGSQYENDYDVSSIGPRCSLNDDASSLIVKTDEKKLTEYSIGAKKKIIDAVTTHPVYMFCMNGNTCQVIEKEGDNYYLELLDWTYPTDFTASAVTSMKVGESSKIQCNADSSFSLDYTYTSSDPKVIHVDQEGNINAWKAGKAVITVTSPVINVTRKMTITVTDSQASRNAVYKTINMKGTVSSNIHLPENGGTYGTTVKSYLTATSDGGYERVEYINNKIIVEKYNSSLTLLSTKTITPELPLFGGFYSGKNYNYIVYGKVNTTQKDSNEVIRVVKYDKNWNKKSQCRITGANTYKPFDAGSLSMDEYDGVLYIHTCHTMYKSSDGENHQANCTFVINETDMVLKDSYTDVMNLSYGYVSHSFMQYIRTDGEAVYRADLGDAYPRGIAVTVTKNGDPINQPYLYGTIMSIPGNVGNNYTGFALSGFELSDDNFIVAGLGIKQISDAKRNIFVVAATKSGSGKKTNWITRYTNNDNIVARQPQLVKLNSNQFLLMWEEYNEKTKTYTTKMVLISHDGQLISGICQTPLALSGCQPIVDNNGYVCWYVTNSAQPVMVKINPYRLSEVQTSTKNLTIFQTKTKTKTASIKIGKATIKSAKNSKKKTIVLKYKKLKNAKKYQIQYATNKKFKKAKSKKTSKLSYSIKKLKKGKTYYVRVRGLNGTKKGTWSKIKKVKIKK